MLPKNSALSLKKSLTFYAPRYIFLCTVLYMGVTIGFRILDFGFRICTRHHLGTIQAGYVPCFSEKFEIINLKSYIILKRRIFLTLPTHGSESWL